MASPSIYAALNTAKREIRVLTLYPDEQDLEIICGMHHVSLDSREVDFEALSYCWGAPGETKPIVVSGTTIQVTVNLFAALQQLRDTSNTRTIWVDAVCINQGDLDERSQQVALMTDIYSTCSNVLIWLGQSTEDSSLGLSGLADLEMIYEFFWPGGNTETAMKSLLERPWFDRVWVIQEMAFAKRGTFMCGHTKLDLDKVQESLAKARGTLKKHDRDKNIPKYFAKLENLFSTRRAVRLLGAVWKLGVPLMNALNNHSDAQATDPRDNVFAFVNMASAYTDLGVVISYHLSVQQVYANLVKSWINKYRSLDIITVYLDRQQRKLDLPSWIPDYSGRSIPDLINKAPFSPLAPGGPFASWPGWLEEKDGNSTISSDKFGHAAWYIDRAVGVQDTLSTINEDHYSKFLTLDGCAVGNIAPSFNPLADLDDAIHSLHAIESINTDREDSDDDFGIIDRIDALQTLTRHTLIVRKPWTEIFRAIEPSNLGSAPYVTGGHKLTAFIQTLFAGYYVDSPEKEAEVREFEVSYRRYMYQEAKNSIFENERQFHPNDNIRLHLLRMLSTRRFAVTRNGYFALVPTSAMPGDIIVVMIGGAVPFVLRQKTSIPPDEDRSKAYLSGQDAREEANGPSYGGTSRKPESLMIAGQQVMPGGGGASVVFRRPYRVAGLEAVIHPSWEVVGTAYVHGVMNGEVKKDYESGKATLSTWLLA